MLESYTKKLTSHPNFTSTRQNFDCRVKKFRLIKYYYAGYILNNMKYTFLLWIVNNILNTFSWSNTVISARIIQ